MPVSQQSGPCSLTPSQDDVDPPWEMLAAWAEVVDHSRLVGWFDNEAFMRRWMISVVVIGVAAVGWGTYLARAQNAAPTSAAAAGGKYTYVVCHGATAGGWEWKKVGKLIEADGHVMYRPSYTGLGDRAHLANDDIDLNTHITDIVNVI